jgi:hypothetical protein
MANNKWKDLMAALPADRQARIKAGTEKLLGEMPLQELRRARELSQEALANLLGERQPSISKLEQRTDMYVSTLRNYVQAMGGKLDIIARFPDGAVSITQFSHLAPAGPAKEQPAAPSTTKPRPARAPRAAPG